MTKKVNSKILRLFPLILAVLEPSPAGRILVHRGEQEPGGESRWDPRGESPPPCTGGKTLLVISRACLVSSGPQVWPPKAGLQVSVRWVWLQCNLLGPALSALLPPAASAFYPHDLGSSCTSEHCRAFQEEAGKGKGKCRMLLFTQLCLLVREESSHLHRSVS